MTTKTRELSRLQQTRFDEKADTGLEIKADLVSVNGSVHADQTQFLVWYQTTADSTPDTVLCRLISPVAGMPVILGYSGSSKVLEVIRINEEAVQLDGVNYATEPHVHNIGQPNMMWLEPEAIVPLSTYPSTTLLKVNVVLGDYYYLGTRKTFAGALDLNIASAQPAGPSEHRFVGLYLDASNALQTVNGTVVATGTDAPEPSWPAGAFQLSVVDLNDTQTTISMTDITNRRVLFTTSGLARAWPVSDEIIIGTTTYASISAAVTASITGDVIFVGPGTFIVEDVLITGKSISIVGSGRTSTILSTASADDILIVDTNSCVFENFSVINSQTTGPAKAIRVRNGGDLIIRNVIAIGSASSSGIAYGVHIENVGAGGTLLAIDCETTGLGSGTAVGIQQDNNASSSVELVDTAIKGATADLIADGGTVILRDAKFVNDTLSVASSCTISGTAFDSNGVLAGHIVTNSSGAAAAKYDIGYLDEAGEYLTTTTAQDLVSWHVVTIGGSSDTGFVFVKNKGLAAVNYTGAAPNAGDFLVTSTTAGKGQQQTTMRPEIFAVCTAGGSGGTVETLLLINRVFVPLTLLDNVLTQFGIDAKTTAWTGTINDAAPTSSPVTVATSTSNINTITPDSASEQAKIVLRNTTRGNEALIDSISTNDITFVSDTPLSTWQNGDALTAQSDENSQAGYQTLDLSLSPIPPLATAVLFHSLFKDTGASARTLILHPYKTFVTSEQLAIENSSTAAFMRAPIIMPLLNRRITQKNTASGSGTAYVSMKLAGYWEATP